MTITVSPAAMSRSRMPSRRSMSAGPRSGDPPLRSRNLGWRSSIVVAFALAVQPAAEGLGRLVEPLRAELGSTIRGTGVKGLSELGPRDVALFSTVHCNVALIRRIQPSRRETYWVSDPGTGVAHPSVRSASGGVRDSATLHGFRWWPVTPTWWLAPVNVARSRRGQGWLAPVNSAPSPSSLHRRRVQRSRFGILGRGSCSRPRPRMPAAMVSAMSGRGALSGRTGAWCARCTIGPVPPAGRTPRRGGPANRRDPDPSSVSAIRGTCGHRVHRARRHLAPSCCTVGGSNRAPLHPGSCGAPPEVLMDRKRVVVSFSPAVIRTLEDLATRPATGRWGGAHGSVLFGSMAAGRRPVFQFRVPRLAPFDASRHDDAAVVALVLLGPAAEAARGALVEVDGPSRLGVDAADGDVDVRGVRVGVGGADRVVAVVETEAVDISCFGGASAPSVPPQHDVGARGSSACARGRRCRPWSSAPGRRRSGPAWRGPSARCPRSGCRGRRSTRRGPTSWADDCPPTSGRGRCRGHAGDAAAGAEDATDHGHLQSWRATDSAAWPNASRVSASGRPRAACNGAGRRGASASSVSVSN